MTALELKICGMTQPRNIAAVAALRPDYIGFVFYAPSPRYAGELPPETVMELPRTIRRVGVFVDETKERIVETAARYRLDCLQLHGRENPQTCRALNRILPVIKAIAVGSIADLKQATHYEGCCSAVLFDTRHALPGGSGKQFDWKLLARYTGPLPFFLSGGIGPEDLERIRALRHPLLKAIDVNSRFETSPGLKNTELLKPFIETLNDTAL